MSFNPLVPLPSDSPGVFPAQNQANMTRLQTLLGADHQFNLSAAADDGYHNLIHMTQQAPSGALAATGRLYVKTAGSFVQLFYMDDAGRAYQITPGIVVAVNFNGTGSNGPQALRTPGVVNVTSVVKTGTGRYTVNFTTPLASVNYIAQVTGMKDDAGEVIGFIEGSGTYSDSVGVNFLKIGFENRNGSNRNVTMGNVLIYSAI